MANFLAIYLRDHHAGARAGLALAHRAVASTRLSPESRDSLRAVAKEIEEDFASLETIMSRLGVAPNPIKDALLGGGARLGVLKLNGRLVRRSPLSDVWELEMLHVGIVGKQSLWRSLLLSGQDHIDVHELGRLIARAERQAARVEDCRAEAVTAAFGVTASQGRAASASV